jgi:leucyl-tRNA synthetase
VQVNGKLRAKLMAPADSENQTIQELVFTDKRVAKFTDGKTILKVIVVPNKLVNVVIE